MQPRFWSRAQRCLRCHLGLWAHGESEPQLWGPQSLRVPGKEVGGVPMGCRIHGTSSPGFLCLHYAKSSKKNLRLRSLPQFRHSLFIFFLLCFLVWGSQCFGYLLRNTEESPKTLILPSGLSCRVHLQAPWILGITLSRGSRPMWGGRGEAVFSPL